MACESAGAKDVRPASCARCDFRNRRDAVVGRQHNQRILHAHTFLNGVEQFSNQAIGADGNIAHGGVVGSDGVPHVIVRRETDGEDVGGGMFAEFSPTRAASANCSIISLPHGVASMLPQKRTAVPLVMVQNGLALSSWAPVDLASKGSHCSPTSVESIFRR